MSEAEIKEIRDEFLADVIESIVKETVAQYSRIIDSQLFDDEEKVGMLHAIETGVHVKNREYIDEIVGVLWPDLKKMWTTDQEQMIANRVSNKN